MDKQLKEMRERLIKETPSLKEVIRGSLRKNYLTCGNPRCRCRKEGGHGPYWYLQVKTKGKNKMYYLPDEKAKEEIEQGITQYNKLWDILCKTSEINIRLLVPKTKKRKRKNAKGTSGGR
jgi:hypothetical protein